MAYRSRNISVGDSIVDDWKFNVSNARIAIAIGIGSFFLLLFVFVIEEAGPYLEQGLFIVLATMAIGLVLVGGFAGLVIIFSALSHVGGMIEIGHDGVKVRKWFTTFSAHWENLEIYNCYNAYGMTNWYSVLNLGTVHLADRVSGKKILLWSYVVPLLSDAISKIEGEMVFRLLPRLTNLRDRSIEFGPIKVEPYNLLSFGSHCIPLSSVVEIRVQGNSFLVYHSLNSTIQVATCSLKTVPNVRLLCLLLHSRGARVLM
jgi:hypothetical protein